MGVRHRKGGEIGVCQQTACGVVHHKSFFYTVPTVEPMHRLSRRSVLKGAAAGTAATVFPGIASGATGTDQESEQVPEWAEWLPSDERFHNENGEYVPLRFGVPEAVELIMTPGSADEGGEPLMSPVAFAGFIAGSSWTPLQDIGMAEHVLGQPLEDWTELDPEVVPTEEQISLEGTHVFVGSYDADEIAATLEDVGFEESEIDGVYVDQDAEDGTGEAAISWSDEYVVYGNSPEAVATMIEARRGEVDRAYETMPEFETLLRAGEPGQYILAIYAPDLFEGGGPDDPLAGSQGWIQSVTFAEDLQSATAAMEIIYPDPDDVQTRDLRVDLIRGAAGFDLEQDGERVSVTATFVADEETATPTPTQTSTPNPTPRPTSPPVDGDDERADEGAPGLGVGSALAALGGAGYLLFRRLENRSE